MSETPPIPPSPEDLDATSTEWPFLPLPESLEDMVALQELLTPKEALMAFGGLTRRLELKNQRLQYELDHDSLTNALTREAFQRQVEIDQQANPGASRGLIFIDLGNFKAANSLLTHAGGDEILQKVTGLFKRVSDVVCRFGGDEFAIYLDTTLDNHTDFEHDKRTLPPEQKLAAQVQRVIALREEIVNEQPALNRGSIKFYIGAGGIIYNPHMSYAANLAAAEAISEVSKTYQQIDFGSYREADLSLSPD